MKHITYFGASVVAAAGGSLLLSIYGAHGMLGLFSVYAGYLGAFVNWKVNPGRVSYVIISAVNAAVYLALLEVLGLLVRYRRSSRTNTRA